MTQRNKALKKIRQMILDEEMADMNLLVPFMREQVRSVPGSFARMSMRKDGVIYNITFSSIELEEHYSDRPPDNCTLITMVFFHANARHLVDASCGVVGVDATHHKLFPYVIQTLNVKCCGFDVSVGLGLMPTEGAETIVDFLDASRKVIDASKVRLFVRDQGAAENVALDQVFYSNYEVKFNLCL